MFEHRRQPLLPRRQFITRLGRSFLVGAILLLVSLSIGMIGYHAIEHLNWIDAFLESSMIMSGMGPVAELKTSTGKFFAGCYALYCGVTLLTSVAVILSPLVHRFFHKFHLTGEKDDQGEKD